MPFLVHVSLSVRPRLVLLHAGAWFKKLAWNRVITVYYK